MKKNMSVCALFMCMSSVPVVNADQSVMVFGIANALIISCNSENKMLVMYRNSKIVSYDKLATLKVLTDSDVMFLDAEIGHSGNATTFLGEVDNKDQFKNLLNSKVAEVTVMADRYTEQTYFRLHEVRPQLLNVGYSCGVQ